jgi:hypothetical protein
MMARHTNDPESADQGRDILGGPDPGDREDELAGPDQA